MLAPTLLGAGPQSVHHEALRPCTLVMRIRVVRKPPLGSIDGIRLDRFEVGSEYELGSSLGPLFLSEGWGVPVVLEPAAPPAHEPPLPESGDPPNLQRETYPPFADHIERDAAADAARRRIIRRVK